jgi:hypothetical protein
MKLARPTGNYQINRLVFATKCGTTVVSRDLVTIQLVVSVRSSYANQEGTRYTTICLANPFSSATT